MRNLRSGHVAVTSRVPPHHPRRFAVRDPRSGCDASDDPAPLVALEHTARGPNRVQLAYELGIIRFEDLVFAHEDSSARAGAALSRLTALCARSYSVPGRSPGRSVT